MFEDIKPHIAELRLRLAISVGSIIVLFFVSFFFHQPILDWMKAPAEAVGVKMVAITIQETFFTALKVAFFSGLILALPIIFWQLWLFLSPGLYENEKKYVIPFVTSATTMFLVGASFAYYIVVPFGFEFLFLFGSNLVDVMQSIGAYVGFFSKLMFGFGVAFELPVLTFFLAVIGLVTDKSLKDFFKFAIIIIFVVSALLTPPDMLTQFLMAGPLIILYGVSILIARAINPYEEVEEDEDDDEDEEEQDYLENKEEEKVEEESKKVEDDDDDFEDEYEYEDDDDKKDEDSSEKK